MIIYSRKHRCLYTTIQDVREFFLAIQPFAEILSEFGRENNFKEYKLTATTDGNMVGMFGGFVRLFVTIDGVTRELSDDLYMDCAETSILQHFFNN